jgi:hypothetical protein
MDIAHHRVDVIKKIIINWIFIIIRHRGAMRIINKLTYINTTEFYKYRLFVKSLC